MSRAGTIAAAVLLASFALVGCTSDAHPASRATSSPSFSYSPSTPSRLPHPPTATATPVASASSPTLSPAPLKSPAALEGGIRLQVTNITTGKATGHGPGVIAGQETVTFTLGFTNSSGKAFSISNVQVNAWYGSSETPASPDSSSGRPFAGTLQAGKSATGSYAFAIPASGQGDVGLSVWYQQGKPTVVFQGAVG